MARISDGAMSKLVAVAIAAVATAAAVMASAEPPAGAAVVASAEPPAGAAACSGCHPASTRVTSPVPRLTGLDPAAIVRAMQDFRSGTRVATVMDRIAKGFTDDEIQAIAAWYATQR